MDQLADAQVTPLFCVNIVRVMTQQHELFC